MVTVYPHLGRAVALALFTPVVLLGGAYISEYKFGLYPCEKCWWQRYPHFVALALALAALAARLSGQSVRAQGAAWILTGLAALAILTSGAIGLFHAGVEYGWWEGPTACANIAAGGSGDFWTDMMAVPVVRCDQPAFTLLGISLAGFNFLFSTIAALWLFMLLRGRERQGLSRVSSDEESTI